MDDWDRWIDDYVAKHSGDTKQAETVEKRLKDEEKRDIIKLPRYSEAVIPKEKFTEYALNPTRDYDKAKAFQLALGYTMENVDELIQQIHEKLPQYDAVEKPDNGWGKRYEVKMNLKGPNRKTANVLTAWIDDKSSGEMRLISAYVDRE